MDGKRDYYEVLNLAHSASTDEVRAAYRKLALQFHPDRNQGSKEAEGKFKEISEAYDILSDDQKRRLYDLSGHAGLRGHATRDYQSASFEEIFSSFADILGTSAFGDFFGGVRGARRGPVSGENLRVDLEISFKEAILGIRKTVEYTRQELCATCNGSKTKPGTSPVTCEPCGGRGVVGRSAGFFTLQHTCQICAGTGKRILSPCTACRGEGTTYVKREIQIDIPAGVANETRLRMPGQGGMSTNYGPSGDLYCDVYVRDDALFKREGRDIHCEIPVMFHQAALGGEIEVPTLDGKGSLKIAKGTRSGTLIRMRGLGVPEGRSRGDQVVRIVIEMPTKLTKRQEELLAEFGKIEQEQRGKKNLWEKITS